MPHRLLSEFIGVQNRSKQLWAAIIGAFLGLLILLLSVQFLLDIRYMTGSGGRPDSRFVIINKKVDLSNTLGKKAAFLPAEIADLKQQAFVESMALFESNRFQVGASSQMMGFYTELFFEALPVEYVDVPNNMRFDWQPGQTQLPIILSRDYLALYNFGFAPSQGLPQFTPSSIKRVPMDIMMRGNGKRETLRGQIIGFSDRINSILVPKPFLDWANERYGSSSASEAGVSRLMLEVDNPYAQRFKKYIEDHGYELSSGKIIGGQLASMLQLVAAVIAFIGLVLLLLSALIFVLIFQLLIAQAADRIRLLIQLGYHPAHIGQVLVKRFMGLIAGVWMLSIVVLCALRYAQHQWFEEQGFQISAIPSWIIFLLSLIFVLLLGYINVRSIRMRVHQQSS